MEGALFHKVYSLLWSHIEWKLDTSINWWYQLVRSTSKDEDLEKSILDLGNHIF